MSDLDAAAVTGAPSAGRLLREAREKQGLHIAALAASIKVTPKKLELLEADRFDALPDATFTRALAQTVCRALKIDSTEILRLLPPPAGHRLGQAGSGLNAPFRDRPGVLAQRDGPGFSFGPWFWITGGIVIAAIGVFFVPAGMLRMPDWIAQRTAAAPAASEPSVVTSVVSSDSAVLPGETIAASGVAAPASEATAPAASVPASVVASTAPAPAASTSIASNDAGDAPVGVLQVRTSEPSWVEITDARGHSLVSRLVKPGEAVGVDGEAPFRLRIGNAGGTRVSFRGQPMELAAYTRDNVARFEVK